MREYQRTDRPMCKVREWISAAFFFCDNTHIRFMNTTTTAKIRAFQLKFYNFGTDNLMVELLLDTEVMFTGEGV